MKFFLLFPLLFVSTLAFSNEVEVIELHENKSLDQMVLDQIEDENIMTEIDQQLDNNEIISSENTNNENISTLNSEVEINQPFLETLDLDFINNFLINAANIKSEVLQNELNIFLSNLELDFSKKNNRDIYFSIVKFFFSKGDLPKAYSIIKSRNLENDENITFYNFVEINYLLSTFQLDEVCVYKDEVNQNLNNKNHLIDKIDIFCLLLQNKQSEAELLNSILQETETSYDENFQNLFIYLSKKEDFKENNENWFSQDINLELIFLYSAMARIAELPLNDEFFNIDKLNIAIPIVLNNSSPIELRINAANYSFINKKLSVDGLAALYQSVDFSSDQINNPTKTIEQLSENINMLMSYYFQLINVQIFPSERLLALINFWEFAKQNNLEEIAYALSYKIVDSIEINSDYLEYGPQIATSYIYNKDYEKAENWIDFYENANGIDEKITFVRILLNLYSSDSFEKIIEIINLNFDKLTSTKNKNYDELMYIFLNLSDESKNNLLPNDLDMIYDNRSMPSLFITENIKDSILVNDENKFFIYSIVSLNQKEWRDVHPNHLKTILDGYLNYKDSSILTNIILEIFKNYKIL